MSDATAKFAGRYRPNILVIVGTLLYFVTFTLALYELDRQHFQGSKSEIIRDNFYGIFSPPADLGSQAKQLLLIPDLKARAAAQVRFMDRLEDIVQDPSHSIYSYVLKDADGSLVFEVADVGKPGRMNTWKNCLILRSFDGIQDNNIPLTDAAVSGKMQIAHLIAHYATPPEYAPIEELTRQYRWYAAGLGAIWAVVYIFLYRYMLSPMQRVTARLSESRSGPPQLISRAGGLLEHSYNEMARQALLQQLEDKLNALTRPGTIGPKSMVIDEALAFIVQSFGLEYVVLAEMSIHQGSYSVVETYTSSDDAGALSQDIIHRAQSADRRRAESKEAHLFEAADGEFTYFDLPGSLALLVFGKFLPTVHEREFRIACIRGACETIRRSILTYRAYQQDIFRQRSEANIVLSRNLGHDLTNIIATSKLELLAVRQILTQPQGELKGARGELLRESVQGLLENTKFLQEIVNIYRSFSHVKRPQYERNDLNTLILEFLASFEPSISSRISIRRELDPQLPHPIIEPRLLKLALFNVLTNSVDAIKKAPRQDGTGSELLIRTSYDEAAQQYTIVIEDNGPGIRDKQGRLLTAAETDSIFQYGYSTKAESSEGLGLSWVRTIVEDFHLGSVQAENRSGSGARFILKLASMESAEAKIR